MNEPSTGGQSPKLLERISDWLSSPPDSRDTLLKMLRRAQQRELFDADAMSMIEGVLSVADLAARDIMVPRTQMDVIDVHEPMDRVIDFVVTTAHSRFPVIEGDRDKLIGVLHAKDLLRLAHRDEDDLRALLRPAVFIPESKRLNVLLRDFRINRNHVAIVVDEYGGVAGLITIEDVLEQIVGDIEDEFDFDEESDHIVEVDGINGRPRYRVRAITSIEQLNERLGTSYSDEDFDTVGGLVTEQFGRVPRLGEFVTLEGFRFEVLRADARSLQLVLVERSDEASPDDAERDDA